MKTSISIILCSRTYGSTGELTRHKLGGNESQMGSKKWYLMTHKNEKLELHLPA